MQNLSPRAAWLYLMRLDGLWASLFWPACRPHPASLPVRVPAVEGLPPASFSFTSRLRPCGSATVAVIGSDWLLSSNKILPMLGTHQPPAHRAEAYAARAINDLHPKWRTL